MIIIIEGPDGSGKTTLANKLSQQTGYPVVHRSAPNTEEEKKEMLAMYKQAIAESRDVIFDRCWYSEMVYGPVMRDKSYMSYEDMYELEHDLAEIGAIIIYCTDKPAKLWSRCNARGEDYIKEYAAFQAIHRGYNKLMGLPHFVPVVRYAYKDVF